MADNLSVSVTADTSELRAQLALAQADLRAFGAETRNLANSIRSGGDASGELRAQLEQVAGQFGAAKGQVAGLTAELRDHKSGLDAVKESLEGTISPITATVGGLRELAEIAGVAFVVDRVVEFATEIAELGEKTLNASAALGLSVPKYAQLAAALQLAGADADTANRALERLAVSLTEATDNRASKAAVAFRNIGFTQKELEASSKDLGVALDTLAAKFADAEKGPRLTAEMSDILSRRLLDALIPALRRGADGMEELRKGSASAADTLAKVTPEAADTNEKLLALKQASSEAGQSFFDTLKPSIDAVTSGLTFLITKLKDATQGIRDMIRAGTEGMLNSGFMSWKSWGYPGPQPGDSPGVSVDLPPVDVHAKRKVGTETAGGHKGGGRGRGGAAKAETDDSEAINLERIGNEEKVDDLILDRRQKLIEAAKAAGKISLDQEYALLVQNLAEKQAADQNYYQQKMAAAQGDAREQQRLTEKEAVDYQQYLTKRQELDTKYFEARKAAEEKAAADSKAAWDQVLAPLTSSFDTAIKGFIQGTTTLQQGLQRAFESVLLDPLLKNLTNGLKTALMGAFSGTDITNSFIGKFFSGTLFGGATSATGPAALGTASTTAAAQVTAFGTAAAAATAQLAATDGVSTGAGVAGAAAPAAAGAGGGGLFSWIGGLLGFARGGIVPSAAGGWALPSLGSGGILAKLHSNEMVLPAGLSQFIQSAAAAGRGGGLGNATLTNNIDARGSQLTAAQFNSMLARSHSELSGMIGNAYRNGWRP
jgi:hypothetical protein